MKPRALAPATLPPVFVAALAAWVSCGAVAVTDATATTGRLGVLPHPAWLAAAMVAVPAAAWAAGLTARLARPLWLTALTLLPWVPGPIPWVFLIWTGPLSAVVWVVALAGVFILRVSAGREGAGWRPRWPVSPALVVAVGTALSVAAAWRMQPVLPGGDEPHYLIIAESLIRDGDLRIENNHQRRDYVTFVEHELRPDFLRRGEDGQIYSVHAPGVAALVAPALALAGYPGVVALLSLVTALGGLLAWRAARIVGGGDPAAGWLAWAAVTLSVPVFFVNFTVYPDGVGAAIVMAGVWALVRGPDRWSWLPLTGLGAALAVLPWLHTRFAVLAGVLGILLALRLWRSPGGTGRVAALLVVPAVSAVAWFGFFWSIYGTPDPRAPYGGYTQSALNKIPRGVLGLVADHQFGVLPTAPVFAIAIAGLVTLWRSSRRLAAELLALVVPYLLAVSAYHMWWGGRSSPARFLVPVLLPMAVPIAAWWHRHDGWASRATALALLALSVTLTVTLALGDDGAWLYNARDGFARWLDWAAPAVNAARGLPSLFRDGSEPAAPMALAWTMVAGAAFFVLKQLEQRTIDTGTRVLVVPLAVSVAVMAGLWAGSAFTRRSPLEPGSGLLALLRGEGAAHGPGVRFGAPAWVSIRSRADLFAEMRIPSASRRPAGDRAIAWMGADLPPGRYRVEPQSGLNVTGTMSVAMGLPIEAWRLDDAAPEAAARTVTLPAGARQLTVTLDEPAQRTMARVVLVPQGPGAPRRRGDLARRGARYGEVAVFSLDASAWIEPDGVWVAGGRTATLVVAPTRADALRLRIRNGAAPNRVRLAAGASLQTMSLTPGEERIVDVPRANGVVEVTVTTSTGFRPFEVEPSNRDVRNLGVFLAF